MKLSKLTSRLKPKSRYSIWIPFASFEFSSKFFIVFIRKKKSNGMASFKTTRVTSVSSCYHQLAPPALIDIKEAWETFKNIKLN